MTRITAAAVHEQGVDFTVVLVKPNVLRQPAAEKNTIARSFSATLPGGPIVLCAQTRDGNVEYWGRNDIVKFLSNIFFEQLPWAEYSLVA